MRVRFKTTGVEGGVLDTDCLPAERVGDLAGTWHLVRWDDTLEQTWVHADSVETVHPDPRGRAGAFARMMREVEES